MMMNKKGLIGDMFDLFYLVAGTIVILVVASLALSTSINSNNQKSLFEVADFKRVDSAVNNLKVLISEGENIDVGNVDNLIKSSKRYEGRTITSCFDYIDEFGCNNDPIKVATISCIWEENECKWSSQPKPNLINCEIYKTESECNVEGLRGLCIWGGDVCLKILQ